MSSVKGRLIRPILGEAHMRMYWVYLSGLNAQNNGESNGKENRK